MNAPHAHAASSEPDVHELDHHLTSYKKIIAALTVLTAIEFGISHLMAIHTLGLVAGIVILVALAFVKAWLVAKFFMHLKYDPRILSLLCLTPLILATPLNVICCFDAIKGPAIGQ